MDQYQKLIANIGRYVSLSPEEQQQIIQIIRTTRVKRPQFIVQPGFVCQHRNYVVEGAFRAYYLDQDGTITFAESLGGDYRERVEPQTILDALTA